MLHSIRFPRCRWLLAAFGLIAALSVALVSAADGSGAGPYSAHSMTYTCCSPLGQRQQAFVEAKAMGAAYIRVDVELNGIVERSADGTVTLDWTHLDEVTALSRKVGLPVLGIIRGTPGFLSSCPGSPSEARCPPGDPGSWAAYAAEIAAHARNEIGVWQIWNEPDSRWSFEGTPGQYAATLTASYRAIRTRVPAARVVLGGVSDVSAVDTWLAPMLATQRADAVRSFDIAALHVRGALRAMAGEVARFRSFLAHRGRKGVPVWVTEHGYPGDRAYQGDPGYRGGEAAQAAYLRDSVPAIVRAGAAQVFVTLRDGWASEFGGSSPFLTEGLIHIDQAWPHRVRRKPAFGVMRWLHSQLPFIPHSAAQTLAWENAKARETGLAIQLDKAAAGDEYLAALERRRAKRLRRRWRRLARRARRDSTPSRRRIDRRRARVCRRRAIRADRRSRALSRDTSRLRAQSSEHRQRAALYAGLLQS